MSGGDVFAFDPTRLRAEADAAWQRYASTCRLGGSRDERRWACERAVRAEGKAQAAGLVKRRGAEAAGAGPIATAGALR